MRLHEADGQAVHRSRSETCAITVQAQLLARSAGISSHVRPSSFPAAALQSPPALLLEEERDVRCAAAIAKLTYPLAVDATVTRSGLTAGDQPVDAVEIEPVQRPDAADLDAQLNRPAPAQLPSSSSSGRSERRDRHGSAPGQRDRVRFTAVASHFANLTGSRSDPTRLAEWRFALVCPHAPPADHPHAPAARARGGGRRHGLPLERVLLRRRAGVRRRRATAVLPLTAARRATLDEPTVVRITFWARGVRMQFTARLP